MAKFIVTANKLNRRRVVPASLPDPNNIIDVVRKNFIFEAEEVSEDEMPSTVHDKWFKDRNGFFYWGGGINELRDLALTGVLAEPPSSNLLNKFQFDSNKMSWAHDSVINGGLGIVELWNEMGVKGESVNVAILDTGIIDHADFKRNGNSLIKETHLISGFNSLIDSAGHGTNSAGILAGTGASLVLGIAPEINLFIVKISENTGIEPDGAEIAEGLKFIKDSNWPVDIISISYCFKEPNQEVENIISDLENNNQIILASLNHRIGGNKLMISEEQFPAAYENVIPIISYAKDDTSILLTPCEMLENKVNWAFPGESILTLSKDGLRVNANFTSISAPLASGIFALFISHMKNKGVTVNKENIERLKNLLISSGNKRTIQIDNKNVNIVFPQFLTAFNLFNQTF